MGSAAGLIEKSGSHFSYGGERIGQGRERAIEWMRERPQVQEELARKLVDAPRDLAPPQPASEAA
jgi:recombination protein RecA